MKVKPKIKVMKVNVGGVWCDAMGLGDGLDLSLVIPLIQVPRNAIKWVEEKDKEKL